VESRRRKRLAAREDALDAALIAAGARRQRRRAPRPGLLVVVLVVLVLLVAAASLGAGFVAAGGANAVIAGQCTLRSVRPISLGANSFVYAANGNRLGAIASNLHRQPLRLDEMTPWLPKATIAIEDRRFYQHGGIDYYGIVRAAVSDLAAGHIVQGGSTLEQELVRNLYLGSDERTFSWKLKQACLAIRIAQRWSKRKILVAYLNQVAYGSHAYGVAAAAQTYFGRPAVRLTLAQAALIAGLPQAPSLYDPFVHPAAARARRNQVLRAMYASKDISRARFLQAANRPLVLHPGSLYVAVHHPGFVGYVQQQLVSEFGDRTVRAGGLKIRTTLRPRLQRAALAAERAVLRHRGDPAAALVSINPRTGAIEAMSSFQPGHAHFAFNLASQGHRQAGSAFKPFTLADAIWNGYTLNSKFRGPARLVVTAPACMNGTKPWVVHNFGGERFGKIRLSKAIADSVNTVFAQLVAKVGPANVAGVARYAGITSPLRPVCSITLGTSPVTPLELADAYATFADGGYHHPTQVIRSVRAPDGHVLQRLTTQGSRAMPEHVSATVTRALEGVVRDGTATAAALPGVVAAGKTGTTENEQDAWFCGYVPRRLATCVWVGFPKAEIPMHDIEGVPEVVGGTLPAEIWRYFMTRALELP